MNLLFEAIAFGVLCVFLVISLQRRRLLFLRSLANRRVQRERKRQSRRSPPFPRHLAAHIHDGASDSGR
jgi:hypothetical protein